jgi:hypothetical protein
MGIHAWYQAGPKFEQTKSVLVEFLWAAKHHIYEHGGTKKNPAIISSIFFFGGRRVY